MSLETFLDVHLGEAIRGQQSTGTSTTKNAKECVVPESVNAWDSILDDLPQFSGQSAVHTAETDWLRHILPFSIAVTAELEITAQTKNAASFVAISCGGHDATLTAQGVRGSPDIRIFDCTTNETKIVGEVKTFWAFPVNDRNLVTLWREGTTTTRRGWGDTTLNEHFAQNHSCSWCDDRAYRLQRKAFEAIRQMNGYMVQNRLIYGFLTTWNQWWFMRTNGRTLWISRSFPHNAQNPSICQVLGRMLLQEVKHFKLDKTTTTSLVEKVRHSMKSVVEKTHTSSLEEGIPSSDIVLQSSGDVGAQSADQTLHKDFSKFLKKISSDPDLLQYFLLSLDLIYVGYGRTGSVFKVVVDLGKSKHIELVLKIADVLKQPTLQEELEFEAQVYKKLNSLQGRCIPYVFLDSPIWFYRGITKCLVMSYEGTNMNLLDVNSIPLTAREKARKDYRKIEDFGVCLLDMKKSNLCWNSLRQRIIFIDFGGVYLRAEDQMPPCGNVYSDDAESLDSILQLASQHTEVEDYFI